MTANLTEYFKEHPQANLADVAYTLLVGRKHFTHRRTLVCGDVNDALQALTSADRGRLRTNSLGVDTPIVAFMFPGQGSQFVNMARELYESEQTFREEFNRCAELLEPHLGFDLRPTLYVEANSVAATAERLKQTYLAQPALFVIEYAMAKLLMEWGIRPQAMVGHSIGEFVAACLAGVFSLEDALKLVAVRGRLMQQMPVEQCWQYHFQSRRCSHF
jgi:acyl transferase domain-containing protein